MWDYIAKISFTKGVYISFVILGNLIAPLWFLFQFERIIFLNLEIMKLVLIAISMSAPLTLVTLLFYLLETEKLDNSNEQFNALGRCSIITFSVFYLPCVIAYFDPMKTNSAIQVMLAVYTGYSISSIIGIIQVNRRRKNQSKPAGQKPVP